jgi:hypothetical protein
MTEMANQPQDKRKTAKRRRRFTLLAVTISLLVAAAALIRHRLGLPSVDERLAVIEAARAIPDSENAATIYDDLLRDPNAASVLGRQRPIFLDEETWNQASTRPWLSTDHPQLSSWITGCQYIIDKLLKAGQSEKCRFPIIIDIQQMGPQMERQASMRQWAFLLRFAANNDVAEGRIDAAITKWRCIVQMGNHLHQQPRILDQLCAGGAGRIAWSSITRFIVEGAPTEMHFRKIEAMPLPTANDWENTLEVVSSVEDMSVQKLGENHGLVGRLALGIFDWMGGMPRGPVLDDVGIMYLQNTVAARGVRMLIALRRHKNKFGDWPGTLDEIRSEVPVEMLVDPFNKGRFVYKLSDDGFALYSKGRNNMDEDGQYESGSEKGPDDWPIWPPKDHGTRAGTTNPE